MCPFAWKTLLLLLPPFAAVLLLLLECSCWYNQSSAGQLEPEPELPCRYRAATSTSSMRGCSRSTPRKA